MKTYCYILGGELIMTSPNKIKKYIPEQVVLNEDTQELETVPAVEGMAYDEIIETTLDGRLDYINGKIVLYTEPQHEITRADIVNMLVTLPIASLSKATIGSETFSDYEVGEIIIKRFFGGNPHSQTARMAELLGIQNKILLQVATEEEMARLADISEMYADISVFKSLFY